MSLEHQSTEANPSATPEVSEAGAEPASADANPSAAAENPEAGLEPVGEASCSAPTQQDEPTAASNVDESTAGSTVRCPDVSARQEDAQAAGSKGPSDNKLRATAPLFLPEEQPSSEKVEDAPDPLRAKAHAILSAAANKSAAQQASPEVLQARASAILKAALNRSPVDPSAAQADIYRFQREHFDAGKNEIIDRLPPHCRRMLRHWCQDPMTGATFHYFLGTLKSFSAKSGYGFLECKQAFADYGTDVFIHKNLVKTPWRLGQVVEFMVMLNNRSQPQAMDVLWLPDSAPKVAPAYPVARPTTSTISAVAPMPPTQSEKTHASQGVPLTETSASSAVAQPVATAAASPAAPEQSAPSDAAGAPEAAKPMATSSGPSAPAINPIALLKEAMGDGDLKSSGSSGSAAAPSPPPAPSSSTAMTITEEGKPRYFGILKSYSAAKGYGFITCHEVAGNHERDTYFDKSAMSVPIWNIGQTVEFTLTFNTRQQPVARLIDWDPVPLIPKDNPEDGQQQQRFRAHKKDTLDKLKKLRIKLNHQNLEDAVVQAIDNQGASTKDVKELEEDIEKDIDYVTYVLDRMGPETTAVAKLKDFVKMLSLLMVAKMLRKKHKHQRLERMVRWIGVLSTQLDPAGVQQHYQEVVSQIESHFVNARKDNSETCKFAQQLEASIQHLKLKGEGLLRQALPAGPVNNAATGMPRKKVG